VPQEITAGRLGDGDLLAIPLEEPWAHRTLMLAVRDSKALPPAARLLMDHLLGTQALPSSAAMEACPKTSVASATPLRD
jgi:hypothetical protein